MTKKEAVERLKYIKHKLVSEKHGQAIDIAIKALEERSTSEWVPVSERLPKEEGEYLVTVYDENFDLKRIDIAWFDLSYKFNHGFHKEATVIAWQYKPEPYKEEENEINN